MLRGKCDVAEDAARRCVGAKMSAAFAKGEERLPCAIDDLVRYLDRGHRHEKAIGIIERCEHPTGVAIGVGIVPEPGMQQRVVKYSGTMFTVALMQRKHGPIIVPIRVAYEGRVDRAARRRGN
jgi:hypothetical protein